MYVERLPARRDSHGYDSGGPIERARPHESGGSSTVMALHTLIRAHGRRQNISRDQHRRLVRVIFPPVLQITELSGDITGLVLDRLGASAAVFGDGARNNVNVGRPLFMTVPRHDSTGLNDQLAHPHVVAAEPLPKRCDIDGGDYRVCDARWR